jgi:hypothetical protein
MSRRWLACCTAVACLTTFLAARALSQDEEPAREEKKAEGAMGGMEGMPSPEQMAEMMKKYEMASKPGKNHELLQNLVGDWKVTTKMWMDPSGPPTESRGRSRCRMMLDGRFVMEEFEGAMTMPNEKGEMVTHEFKGMGLTGFDNVKNLFVGTWADSMGTGIMSMSGSYNPMKKTLTMYGHMDDVGMGVYGKTVRMEQVIVDKDKHVFTMYDCHAGPDYKCVEVTYSRS